MQKFWGTKLVLKYSRYFEAAEWKSQLSLRMKL